MRVDVSGTVAQLDRTRSVGRELVKMAAWTHDKDHAIRSFVHRTKWNVTQLGSLVQKVASAANQDVGTLQNNLGTIQNKTMEEVQSWLQVYRKVLRRVYDRLRARISFNHDTYHEKLMEIYKAEAQADADDVADQLQPRHVPREAHGDLQGGGPGGRGRRRGHPERLAHGAVEGGLRRRVRAPAQQDHRRPHGEPGPPPRPDPRPRGGVDEDVAGGSEGAAGQDGPVPVGPDGGDRQGGQECAPGNVQRFQNRDEAPEKERAASVGHVHQGSNGSAAVETAPEGRTGQSPPPHDGHRQRAGRPYEADERVAFWRHRRRGVLEDEA